MNKLVIVALLSELLTPILIWKAGLPSESRWLSSAVLVVVLMDGYARLMRQGRVPSALWVIAVLSIVGISRALLSGQSVAATVWGWWLMFRYPLVGLYVYLQPHSWGRSRPQILKWAVLLLCFEVLVQVGQYATGEAPGDQLAGTLGQNGTGSLALIVLLVLALALGEWIARGRLAQVALVTGLGLVSSTLGEMKVFFFAAGAMAVISLAIHLNRKHRLAQVLPYGLLLTVALVAFPSIYDSVVPGASERPFADYFDPERLTEYTTFIQPESDANYEVGRVYALTYAWEQISDSPFSMAFGDGLGARGESKTLGSTGVTLLTGELGVFIGGGTLSVVIGELGILGILALLCFVLWVTRTLWTGAGSAAAADTAELQYGLLIYSLMWPVWVWYNVSWALPVPMLLYWPTLGYCLAHLRRAGLRQRRPYPALTRTGQLVPFRSAGHEGATLRRRVPHSRFEPNG